MFSYAFIALALPGILFILCNSCQAAHNWEFELIDVYHSSNNEELLNSNLARKRLNRTAIVIDGEVQWNFDASEETTFEMRSYSSPNNGIYTLEPYEVPRQPLFTFLSGDLYQDVLYPTIGHCSNIPKVSGDFVPPLEKQTFKLDNCYPDISTLPHLAKRDFLYKVEFLFEDPQVKANVTIIYQAVGIIN